MVELAYRAGGSTEEWMLTLLRCLPWVQDSCAAFAYEVDIADVDAPEFHHYVSLSGECDERWVAQGHQLLVQSNDLSRLYRKRVTTALSTFGESHPVVARFLAEAGIRDGTLLFALDARGAGLVLSTQSKSVYHLSAADKYVYTRLTSHIAAGARLRASLGSVPGLEHADAIVSPDGKRVLHASRGAQEPGQRSLLREFAMRVDQARASSGTDPVGSLETWTALLDGRWSMIDHFDSDGRRFCMFVRNDPRLDGMRALTTQQRQVVGLAALGVSNKLIAYEVGISEAGVSQALRAAMKRLGINRRTQLIRVLGPLAQAFVERTPIDSPRTKQHGSAQQ